VNNDEVNGEQLNGINIWRFAVYLALY